MIELKTDDDLKISYAIFYGKRSLPMFWHGKLSATATTVTTTSSSRSGNALLMKTVHLNKETGKVMLEV